MSKPLTRKQVVDRLKKAGSNNAGKPSIELDLVRILERWYDEDKRPLYVYCNITSAKCGMTAKAYFQEKLDQYGSIEALLFEYKGKRGKAFTKPKIVKGRVVHKHVAPAGSYMISNPIKFDKKGEPTIFRHEVFAEGKLVIVRDFCEATGEYKYIKGTKDIFNKTHTYVRVADRKTKK